MTVMHWSEYNDYFDEVYHEWTEFHDEESAREVAEVCILNRTKVSGEWTLYVSAAPYHNKRIAPSAVIIGSSSDLYERDDPDSLRETAVMLFARELERRLFLETVKDDEDDEE